MDFSAGWAGDAHLGGLLKRILAADYGGFYSFGFRSAARLRGVVHRLLVVISGLAVVVAGLGVVTAAA